MKLPWVLIVSCCFCLAVEQKKVVVIGFDGADHQLVQELLDKGALPHLQRLKEMGGFSRLIPTNPPQTPVSWSTFATGINPGRTGIFDFLNRRPGTYIPNLALQSETRLQLFFGKWNAPLLGSVTFLLFFLLFFAVFRKKAGSLKWGPPLVLGSLAAYGVFWVVSHWVPTHLPGVRVVRQGKPIWTMLEERGKSAAIIRLPVTFPAESLNGEMISGLPVPDIRLTFGKPTIYCNDPLFVVEDNKFSVEIKALQGEGPFKTTILGPPNRLFYDGAAAREAQRNGRIYAVPKDFELPLEISHDGNRMQLLISGQSHHLAPKTWSPWIEFHYKVNPIITMKGFGRFYLDYLKGDLFKLYLTPVHFHPDNPLPLSYPPELALQQWEKEPYKTMGWALDTWSNGGNLMSEEHFLEDMDLTVTRFETMMNDFLEQNDRDLFVQVFSFTDRIGHLLWRFWDEGHPLYEADRAPKFRNALVEAYKRMDRIVGEALAKVDLEKTVFLVCSDHGFASWRYQFNFNTWLVKNGFMSLKKNVLGVPMELDDLQNNVTPFNHVDWANTKAYAIGLGMMYINLEGREPEGSVKQADYDAICAEIAAKMEAFVDEKTGLKPVRKVHFRDDIYSGYDREVTPDLRVATAPFYRVSWDTTLGGMPAEITETNTRNWSGDHCSLDPYDVPGILFSSVPIRSEEPHMIDMCPSILALLGVETDVRMDGKPIF